MTLDGVMQAPGHDEHPDGKNTWALAYAGPDQQRYKIDETMEAMRRAGQIRYRAPGA